MITSTNPSRSSRYPATSGFTLVEILVVITIIGILAGVLIPAISNALTRAKTAAQRLEINALDQAVKAYEAKYGDYPPDGSNGQVLTRHIQKLFPRMTEPDITLMSKLVDNKDDNSAGAPFSSAAMDRSEALVFFLGGFSKDLQHPITGSGGPIELIAGKTSGSTNIGDYQYNATRDNAFFDFNTSRLTLDFDSHNNSGAALKSNDEQNLGHTDPIYGGNDLLPAYQAVQGDNAPIVYFDSRTYGVVDTANGGGNLYNGYYASSVGGVRPYKSGQAIKPPPYATEQTAFAAVAFQNANTFQIVSPGSDLFFGKLVSENNANHCVSPLDSFVLPVHFTSAGVPYWPKAGVANSSGLVFSGGAVGSNGFQDSKWGGGELINGNLDNVTNFTESTLGNGLE